MIKKAIFILSISALSASAAIWSLTMMEIPVEQLPPIVTQKMQEVNQKMETMNSYYEENIKEKTTHKNLTINNILILEKQIGIELKNIVFNKNRMVNEDAISK